MLKNRVVSMSDLDDAGPNIHYRSIFRQLPYNIVLLDVHLKILDVTDSYTKTTTKDRSQLIGAQLFVNFPETLESEKYSKINDFLMDVVDKKTKEKLYNIRYDIANAKGVFEPHFWTLTGYPIFAGDDQVEYLLYRTEDVTKQVRENKSVLMNTAEIFELMIANIKDYAIIMLDPDGYVRTWNEGAKRLKLYEAEEIIGKHFSIFYPDEDLKSHKPERELEVVRRDGRMEDENWRKRKDGTFFWADVIISAVYDKDGSLVGFAKITRDLTEKKMNEEKIIEAYKESARLKSEFLANMSHEIRTPMNGVMSAASILQQSGDLNQEHAELVDIIIRSGQTMVKLIDDILDYTKMESDRVYVVFEAFDLYKEVEEVVKNFASIIVNPVELTFKIDEEIPRFVRGDRLRLHQVLSNLLDNAVKFTEKGSIKVEVHRAKNADLNADNFKVQFSVADTGIGISEEDVEKLFKPFSQLEKFSTKKHRGTGLGLALSRRLVEIMRGDIWVRSSLGTGSTFYFTVLFQKSWHEEVMQKESKDKNRRGDLPDVSSHRSNMRALFPHAKILVVEDNPINQNVVKRVLKRLGYKNIDIAADGQEGVDKFSESDYDLILMDVQMPVMDGFEATHVIRTRNFLVPIVAMTANALKGDAEKCLQAGMNDYVPKPIDLNLLSAVLNYWLEEKHEGSAKPPMMSLTSGTTNPVT